MGGKGSGKHTNAGWAVNEDSNRKTIAYTTALNSLPPIDLGDPEAFAGRVDEFMRISADTGMRPMVGGLALAIGVSRRMLNAVLSGERSGARLGFTPETKLLLQKAMDLVEANFEQLLTDARNPVPFIFYAKANLGWKEAAAETVVTHREERPQLDGKTAEEIAGRYLAAAGVERDAVEGELVVEEEEEERAALPEPTPRG